MQLFRLLVVSTVSQVLHFQVRKQPTHNDGGVRMVMNAIIRFVYLAVRCSLRLWVCMCLCEAERTAHDAPHTSLLLQHFYFAVKAHGDAIGEVK